jgi:hypothetical protein
LCERSAGRAAGHVPRIDRDPTPVLAVGVTASPDLHRRGCKSRSSHDRGSQNDSYCSTTCGGSHLQTPNRRCGSGERTASARGSTPKRRNTDEEPAPLGKRNRRHDRFQHCGRVVPRDRNGDIPIATAKLRSAERGLRRGNRLLHRHLGDSARRDAALLSATSAARGRVA